MDIVQISDLAEPGSIGELYSVSPCIGGLPYNLYERIFWAFRCGIKSRLGESDVKGYLKDFVKVYIKLEARAEFSYGFVKGVFDGAVKAVDDFVEDVKKVLQSLKTILEKFYSMTYDLKLWVKSIKAYATAPGSAERTKALEEAADYFSKEHPEAASTFRYLAMVEPALKVLVEWISKLTAAQIIVKLSREMGNLIGDELKEILSQSPEPKKQGQEVGKIIGDLIIQVALGALGWIDIIASLLLLDPELRRSFGGEEGPI